MSGPGAQSLPPESRRRWLLTGATGQLGGHVLHELAALGSFEEIIAWSRRPPELPTRNVAWQSVDLRELQTVREQAARSAPTHILHLAGVTSVAEAHARPHEAQRINVEATAALAEAAQACRARLVFSSTDMVFDGQSPPYREADPPCPLSRYGHTKWQAEQSLSPLERAVIARLPLMVGWPRIPKQTTFTSQIEALRQRQPLRLFTDEWRTPLWLQDAARALIALALSDATGLIHIGGPERLSRWDLGRRFAEMLGIENPRIEPASRLEFPAPEPRPADLSLDSSLFRRRFPQVPLRSIEQGQAIL